MSRIPKSLLAVVVAIPLLLTTGLPAVAAPSEEPPFAGAVTPPTTSYTENDEVHLPQSVIDAARERIIAGRTANSSNAATIEKIYISVTAVTPATGDDVNSINQTQAQALVTQLNSYWNDESNGNVTVVFGGFETRSMSSSSCVPNTVFNQGVPNTFGGIFANGNWVDTHNHLLILTKEACGGQAFGTVGDNGGLIFSGAGISANLGVPIAIHELGHNIGFHHANATICASTTKYDAPQASLAINSTTCPTEEYGDLLDIMGYTVDGVAPRLSSPNKIKMGWISNYSNITTNNTSTTLQLSALGTSTGTQAARVVDPTTGDVYYVEYRAAAGKDLKSISFGTSNLCWNTATAYIICDGNTNPTVGSLRILREMEGDGTTVLAVTPTSGQPTTTRNTHLNVGGTFTNHTSKLKVTVNSMSPSTGASVTITLGTPPVVAPSNTSTTISLSTATSSLASKQVVVSASVAQVSGVYPAGSFKFYDGTTSLGSLNAVAGKADYSLPIAFPVGQHNITAKFIPTSATAYNLSTSSVSSLVITKAPTTSTSPLSSVTVSQYSRYGTSVTIAAKNVKTFTGTVSVFVDGQSAISYPISTSSTTTKLSLPYLTPGTHQVYIKYNGDTVSTTSVSKTVTITSV